MNKYFLPISFRVDKKHLKKVSASFTSFSSSYGGRKPLGGSYLFDRESNVISDGRPTPKAEESNKPHTNISEMTMERETPKSAEAAALSTENQVQEASKRI